jgi:hypothetical protein
MNPEGDSGAAEQQHLDFCSKSDYQQGVPTNSLRQGLRFRWNPDTRKESMAHGKEAQRDLERNPSTDYVGFRTLAKRHDLLDCSSCSSPGHDKGTFSSSLYIARTKNDLDGKPWIIIELRLA